MKELFKNGMIYGITSSLQNVLSFILLPLLTIYYTPAEFGIYSIVLLAGTLANAIFYLGAGSALGRFYFDIDTDCYKRQIVSTSLFITLIGAVILVILSFLFKIKLSRILFNSEVYSTHLFFAFVGTAFGFLLNILTLMLRYEKRAKAFMLISISGVILNFLITYILLVKFNYGILAPILGTMLSNIVFFFILFFNTFGFIIGKIQFKLIHSLLNFGLQSSITGICFFLLDWIDRLIIKEMLPMSEVGIYSLGYRLGSIVNVLLIIPFGLIWAPTRMEYFKNKDYDFFVSKVVSYFFLIGFFVVFTMTIYSDVFMKFFFSNKQYVDASKIFPIVMFAFLIYGLQNILDFGIYYHKKMYYYILISVIGILINVVLNIIFIPKYGYFSAAYITLLTYFFTTTLIYIVSNKYYIIKIEWARILILCLILFIFYYLTNYIDIFKTWGHLKRIVLLFFSAWLVFRYWFDEQEKFKISFFFKKSFGS